MVTYEQMPTMICHRLLFLALFLASSHQTRTNVDTDIIRFKPIDRVAKQLANDVLREVSKPANRHQNRYSLDENSENALNYVRSFLREYDSYNITKGIQLARVGGERKRMVRGSFEERESLFRDLFQYADNHIIKIQLYDLYEDISNKIREKEAALDATERSFGLKKLMVPVMIGMQIVKSVLFAMFLPSILGNLGRVVGEGVKYLSAQGQHPMPNSLGNTLGQMEEFEFKDINPGYEQQYPDVQTDGSSSVYSYANPNSFDYNKLQSSIATFPQSSVASRFTTGAHKLNYVPNNNHHGSFYTKHSGKRQNFKVFHNIPSSSLLLTNYDPFYSPLLSRMDTVFKQLGYETESCRERLVCLMYKNPAKFAPYSNLMSAQLSRELNELRKPSTDNPDILRFFKYMKAAKDGQDGQECSIVYPGCEYNRESISSPMVKTFNEINKLVHARKLFK